MKSRKFKLTHSAATADSATQGFLVANSGASPDAVAATAVRRFELRHNQSPRFARRRKERHQGQALLLAVLIMLLAALLSAGFLAVVSGNLNQSARVADKTRAIEASRAGIVYANAQLSGSAQGDLWRPIDVSPAPDPASTDPTEVARYNFYYSQLEKVQGWSAKPKPKVGDNFPNADYPAPISNYDQALDHYNSVTYGKFPDPNQVAGDAPKFLVKVREVPANPADPEYEADHVGEIKITSIGLSEDNPNVFNRAVAYKLGRRKSPWASALRSVSNWDWKNNLVPQARVSEIAPNGAAGITKVTVINTNIEGEFPTLPFNVVLSHRDTTTPANSRTFGGVVTATAATTVGANPATEYTITGVAPAGFAAGDALQVAAALGTAQTIDLLNTGTAPTLPVTAAEPLLYPTQNQPNGILANGSLWLQGQYQLTSLQRTGSKIQSAGAIFLSNTTLPAGTNTVPIGNGNVDVTAAGNLTASSTTTFPGGFTTASGVKKTDLVTDAWDRLSSFKSLGLDYTDNREQTRVVEPFQPVKIDSAQNLARYRALTRNSAIVSPLERQGLYIDNREDVEKVGTRPMTQQELNNMLLSPATVATNFTRNGVAEASNAPDKSLEEQHLRGWVGPDEFLPRGALIEIMPANGPNSNHPVPFLRVTLDARGDNTAADLARATGPVTAKAWRKADGTVDNGVYTRDIRWPINGTIFAEGNVRIRGVITDPANRAPRSLTVVSMGNIYIDGSVSVDNRTTVVGGNVVPDPNRSKLMLLAKKNVIVNPTRAVIGRTDVQTRTNTAFNQIITAMGTPDAAMTITIPTVNSIAFNRGDYVVADGEVSANDPTLKKIRGLVLTSTGTEITVSTNDAGIIRTAAGSLVRSPMEPRASGTGRSVKAFYSLVDTENAINRRIFTPLANATLNKLVFDHVGEIKKAPSGATMGLKIKAIDYTPTAIPLPTTGFTAELTNKQKIQGTGATENVDASSASVDQADKQVRIYNNFNGGQRDVFNQPPADKTLNLFAADISAFLGVTDGAMTDPKGYKYLATLNEDAAPLVDPNVNNRLASIGTLPYYALTSVGLRYEPGPPAAFVNKGRKQFALDTTPALANPPLPADVAPNTSAIIPLATSVEYDLNSNLSTLVTSTTSGAIVPYLGFNPGPIPGSPTITGFAAAEDTLTVDSTFYQSNDDVVNSTLDQRVLNITNPTVYSVNSVVLKRSSKMSSPLVSRVLPEYRVRALKLENFNVGSRDVRPIAQTMQINAYVYAQEGSWLVVPGDYFRTDPMVRADVNAAGNFTGSYIDYNGNKSADPGEFLTNSVGKYADLNRNGINDPGEREAALRLVRYNNFKIQFFGAIIENQSAVVADIKDAAGTNILAQGAVQDWMDKWADYDDTRANANKKANFSFINYAYDTTLAEGRPGANELSVPVTDDLLYQQ